MIDVSEASGIINNCRINLPVVLVPLQKAAGRVLRQQVIADDSMPPFDRVMMDGIAIRFDDFESGLRVYAIEGVQPAGTPKKVLKSHGGCLEVMTGGVVPDGADTIVPYEDINIADGKATINIDSLVKGKNIHRRGTDRTKGEVLLEEGTIIGTPEIGLMASVGLAHVRVTRHPKIAIISTGSELVEIDQKPLPHQIRRSNVYALAGELRLYGISATLHHCDDDKEVLRSELEKLLAHHDILLLSGGVSKGKFDFIPEVLQSLGVTEHFHRIRQKPGKPFWFGSIANEKVVFAFPGNPVSTFLCYHRYFVPWLRRCLGDNSISRYYANMADTFQVKTSLTYFLQVRLAVESNGQLTAFTVEGKGSGDHANLTSANAFLEIPAGHNKIEKGDVFEVFPFRRVI